MDMEIRLDAERTVAGLVARIQQAAAAGGLGPDRVQDILAAALSDSDDWLEHKYQRRDTDRDWMLYPLFRAADGSCSMIVAVFKPGVATPAHTHGSWAVIGTYRGRERETWFRRRDEAGPAAQAALEKARTFVNEAGAVSVVPDGVIHTVEALDGQDAISIHVYGTDIVVQERSAFDVETGAEETFRPDFAPTANPSAGLMPARHDANAIG